MATAVLSPSSAQGDEASAREPVWPLYAVLAASLCIAVGLIWDISWHRTIGRDTFWSPPHLLEQLAAVIAGTSCGWLVLHITFRGSVAEKARTVSFWGFRGPLGAWVCIWGTLMMIASAPFDDWWHNAYGLDVKIISPPHMVLAWGMIAIQIGAMLMTLARQNRAAPEEQRRLSLFFIIAAAILLAMHSTVLMENGRFANQMHGSLFYMVTAVGFPFALTMFSRASRLRWPATTAAALYMLIDATIMWTLQLFPAQAMLAPIFNPVTHMVPQPFPLLLVVPAFGIDLLVHRLRTRNLGDWALAPVLGATYVLLLLSVQWFFADFLLSPYARNIFFAADKWDYYIQVTDWRYEYWTLEVDADGNWVWWRFWGGIGIAVFIATVSARIGLALGRGMTRVQR